MIIKTLLKYKIFEYCLDTIFDKISVNFSQVKSGIPKKGDKFFKIDLYHRDQRMTHYNCTILDVYYLGLASDWLITFDYTETHFHTISSVIGGHAISAYYLGNLVFTK